MDWGGPTHTITFEPTRVAGEEEGRVEAWEFEADGVGEEFKAFEKALLGGTASEAAKDVEARSGPRAAVRDLEMVQRALESGGSGSWVPLTV